MNTNLAKQITDITKSISENQMISNLLITESYSQERFLATFQNMLKSDKVSEDRKVRAQACIDAIYDVMMTQTELTVGVITESIVADATQLNLPLDGEAKVIKMEPKKDIVVETKPVVVPITFERFKVLNVIENPKDRNQSLFNLKELNECQNLPLLEMKLREYVGTVDINVIRNLYIDFIETSTFRSTIEVDLKAPIGEIQKQQTALLKDEASLVRLKSNQEAMVKRFSAQIENYKQKIKAIKPVSGRLTYQEFLTTCKTMYAINAEEAIKYIKSHFSKVSNNSLSFVLRIVASEYKCKLLFISAIFRGDTVSKI